MKVEELQSIWSDMSTQLEHQKKLTDEIIIEMTQIRYTNKLRKIARYEGTGAIICFILAVTIMLNFGKLDSWYLQLCGIFTTSFLLILPVLVLRSIRAMQRINISSGSYSENLEAFTKARNQFLFIQRIGIGLAFVLILTTLPVSSKIIKGKDMFADSSAWIWYIPIMIIFLVLFSRWGYRAYKNITASAEDMIRELAEK